MRRISFLAFFLTLTALVVVPSSATTVRSFSTEQLTLGAEVIIEGHCLDTETRWIDGNLVTTATMQVDARLKGNPPALISVVLPGGIDLDREVPVQVSVPGVPTFAAEEEVLLFLVPYTSQAGAYTVLGMAQGKFTVATGPTGAKRARSDLTGLRLVAPETGSSGSDLDLHQFRRQIGELLAQPPPTSQP